MNKLQKAFCFQGNKNKKNYFEGWYYKLVSKDSKSTLALIPGISLNKKDSHSFIQVFLYEEGEKNNDTLTTHYLRFDIDDFRYDKELHQVFIKDNLFSLDKVSIDYQEEQLSLRVDISLFELSPVETSLFSPSIMGPFQYVPKMECYHSVVSMSHNLKGNVSYNDKAFDFNSGNGYMEKDYGTSFPKEYIWLQSNNFTNKNTSFMFSYAVIPFIGLSFKGVICSLVYNDKEYRFATYNFTKTKLLNITNEVVEIELRKGKTKLLIEASSSNFKDLPSPVDGEMKNTIKEGLSGEVKIKLYQKSNLLYEDVGTCSGIEIMMKR